jgi:tRNA-dihydrouridine synthase B
MLAPMEGVSDLPFRIMCKRLGADLVFTEFIASDALIRDSMKSKQKMDIVDEERPVAVQIFGQHKEAMVHSAKMIEDSGAEIVDINYGCWVKKVVNNNSGAAYLKDPERMADMTNAVANAVSIPVTIKTRIGWDHSSIVIEKVAKMQEEAGAKQISLHCRTRDMGMTGKADWSWIDVVKPHISIPLILNGDIKTPQDVLTAFQTTKADGMMIGRAAVGYPFLFRRTKVLLETGIDPGEPSVSEMFDACIQHLDLNIKYKGESRGFIEFRKHYSGYLRGLFGASSIRQKLVLAQSYDEVRKILDEYLEYLDKEDRLVPFEHKEAPKVTCRNI